MENGNSFSTSLPWRSFKAGFRLTGLAEGSRCRCPEWANHIGLNARPPFRPLPDGKIVSLTATSAGGKTGSNNLRARAKKQGLLWLPVRSGGNHAAPGPQPVLDLLGKRLNGSCPDSFVASEALRLHHFKLARAQVRTLTPCGRITTPKKSIGNWARRRNAPGDQAWKEKRSARRPTPRCPWWIYGWSVRPTLNLGPAGRVPIGTPRLRMERPPGSRVGLCLHPDGHHSVRAAQPDPQQKPVLLFTNRPK
jgi:hypothetical protein